MAVLHTPPNTALAGGSRLAQALRQLEEGRAALIRERDTLIASIDGGDSNDPTKYNQVVVFYGFGSNDYAVSAKGEIASACGALDGIAATLDQLFTRLR